LIFFEDAEMFLTLRRTCVDAPLNASSFSDKFGKKKKKKKKKCDQVLTCVQPLDAAWHRRPVWKCEDQDQERLRVLRRTCPATGSPNLISM